MIFGTNAIARVACILAHKPDFLFDFGAKAPSVPWPPLCRGFTITHNDVPQSVGLLRTSDRSVAETST